jgi:hypothetical protein
LKNGKDSANATRKVAAALVIGRRDLYGFEYKENTLKASVLWGEIEIYGNWDGECFVPEDYSAPNKAAKDNIIEIIMEHIDYHDPGHLERKAQEQIEEEKRVMEEVDFLKSLRE